MRYLLAVADFDKILKSLLTSLKAKLHSVGILINDSYNIYKQISRGCLMFHKTASFIYNALIL